MKIFYFTATGNSLFVAKSIGGELSSIPQELLKISEIYEDDIIGIVFPVYGFSLPKIVYKFLKQTKLKAGYTFAVGTYGCMSGKIMNEVQKIAKISGYQFDYIDTILMVDNYLPLFDINSQIEKIPNKKIDENIERIKKNVYNKFIQKELKYKFSDNIMQYVANKAQKYVLPDNFANKYILNDNCTKCGICSKVCPVKNIKITDKVEYGNYCESCLACINICPQNAIHLNNEKSAKRWLNPNITIEEIINANNIIEKNHK